MSVLKIFLTPLTTNNGGEAEIFKNITDTV
jgi:hypothetical protein